jgi:hypothetical protein
MSQIKMLLTNFLINTGREAQAIYIGTTQAMLLKAWAEENCYAYDSRPGGNEVLGVKVYEIIAESHLRVS